MRKVRLKGVMYVAQGHRRSSWNWNTKESSLCWREMGRSIWVRHRVLNIHLIIQSHLITTSTLWGTYYYCSHFTDEGTVFFFSYAAQNSHSWKGCWDAKQWCNISISTSEHYTSPHIKKNNKNKIFKYPLIYIVLHKTCIYIICVYIYIHIYVCVYTYLCVYIFVYMRIHTGKIPISS